MIIMKNRGSYEKESLVETDEKSSIGTSPFHERKGSFWGMGENVFGYIYTHIHRRRSA